MFKIVACNVVNNNSPLIQSMIFRSKTKILRDIKKLDEEIADLEGFLLALKNGEI